MKGKQSVDKIRFGTCSKDCYGSCVFEGYWDDKALERKFLSANPSKTHPFTNGFFCPKFKHRERLLYHLERIKTPLIRSGTKPENKFKEIPLREALQLIGEKIKKIQATDNTKSILGAFYAGNSGIISQYAPLRFFEKLGATITSGGICNEGGIAGLIELFGTYSTTNPFQIVNPSTKLIVNWGSNLSESNNHAYYLVKKALKNGSKLVVVDSRQTFISQKAHLFLHIFPGTEHLLARLTINEIIANQAHDKDFLNNYVDSYSNILQEVTNADKEKLLSQVGIDFQTFSNFVDFIIKFKHHTVFNVGYGVQKDFFGGRIVKSIALIQIMLGNIGKLGTGLIYSQSDFIRPVLQPLQEYITNIKGKSKLNKIPIINLGSFLSSGNFQMLFVYNFNPASSLPNQNLLRSALMRDDLFIVVLDMFLNETTKYADIVIPAKFDLESNDLISPYYTPGLSINIGGPCPYQNCMSNYEFFQNLVLEIDIKNKDIFQESEETIFRNSLRMLPANIQEDLESKGYYLLFGMDSVPFSNLKFPTPNTKIQLVGPLFNFGKRELMSRLNMKKNEFLLISPSHLHFLHSQLVQLNKKYLNDFNKIFLTSTDIQKLDLEEGCKVKVSNEYGSGIYILSKSPILKPKTALIYSGLSSTIQKGANVNLFISDKPEELGLSGAYNSAIIKIEKYDS
ncbi:MAG: molybdopterin-dependent oxidoreductase [Candidatus Hermodarchaeota archaeon]